MLTSFTNKQLNLIKTDEGKAEVINDFVKKYSSFTLASDLVEMMIKSTEGMETITITPEEAEILKTIFVIKEKAVLPVYPPYKVRKPRKKVEYSEEEIAYRKALMNNVILPCKGKSEADKAKIKADAEKILKPLREKANKAKIARQGK